MKCEVWTVTYELWSLNFEVFRIFLYEPPHDKTNKMAWMPDWSVSSLSAQPHCWFCHEVAHIYLTILENLEVWNVNCDVWTENYEVTTCLS